MSTPQETIQIGSIVRINYIVDEKETFLLTKIIRDTTTQWITTGEKYRINKKRMVTTGRERKVLLATPEDILEYEQIKLSKILNHYDFKNLSLKKLKKIKSIINS